MDNLYIVIPAYNEEENIEQVVREWYEIVRKIGDGSSLVVIDDGSKDNTYNKLLALKNECEHLVPITKKNSGHGSTILFGYNYALKNNCDYIFQTDSDGQTLASEFWQFWEERKEYDAIIGHRSNRQDGFSRIIVTKVLKLVLFCIFGFSVVDANTPYRLMSKELLSKHIGKVPDDFNLSNVMLSVLFINAKEKVKYIPITFRPRQGGVNSINLARISKIGWKAIKDFLRIKKEIKAN